MIKFLIFLICCFPVAIPRAGRFCEFGLCEAKQNRSEALRTSETIAEKQDEQEGAILQSRSQSKLAKPDGARYKSWTYQYEVSACCIFQNEARFLKEWIDYHLLIGVEHFYVYDNLSEDNALEVLSPYIETGIVDYILWDRTYDSPGGWWHVQREAYIDAMQRALGQSKWLCVIDTDEFIVPIKDENIKVFLRDYEEYGGVCLNWVFYGTSGVKRIPEGQWMVSYLLQRARLSYSQHRTIKTIAQPERVDAINSFFPHICAYRKPFYHVDPNKKRIINKESIDICIDRIRLHHYWSRDLDFLLMEKFPRNERWYGTEVAIKKINEEKTMNAEYDPIILDVIKRLKAAPK